MGKIQKGREVHEIEAGLYDAVHMAVWLQWKNMVNESLSYWSHRKKECGGDRAVAAVETDEGGPMAKIDQEILSEWENSKHKHTRLLMHVVWSISQREKQRVWVDFWLQMGSNHLG